MKCLEYLCICVGSMQGSIHTLQKILIQQLYLQKNDEM